MPFDSAVHRRFEVRRAVHLTCAVRSELWDGPAPFLATDLSANGLRLCSPLALPEGQDLVVTFTPPRWGDTGPINALARVTHVALPRRAADRLLAQPGVAGMGLSFSHIDATNRALLALALRGLPPPLPLPADHTRAALEAKSAEERQALDDELETLFVHDGLEIVLRAEAPLLCASMPKREEMHVERTSLRTTHAASLRRRFRSYRFRAPHQRGAADAQRRCSSLELVS
jgi:hypothetical protein